LCVACGVARHDSQRATAALAEVEALRAALAESEQVGWQSGPAAGVPVCYFPARIGARMRRKGCHRSGWRGWPAGACVHMHMRAVGRVCECACACGVCTRVCVRACQHVQALSAAARGVDVSGSPGSGRLHRRSPGGREEQLVPAARVAELQVWA
jgi:hypothetical protein